MRTATILAATLVLTASAEAQHLNPMVDLLARKQPLFGLYAPANPRAGRGGGRGGPGAPGAPDAQPPAATPAPAAPVAPQKTPAELAKDALGYAPADYIFDGGMECGRGPTNECFDRSYSAFGEFVKGYVAGSKPADRLKHPLVVKMHEVAPDPALASANIGRQLNLGVSTVVLVGVESPNEVKTALTAMRFKARGGTRPDDVGGAPAFWGMSEKQYKDKADVWPLNPKGELLNWTIVESKEGLAHVREIAAVPGIAVLFPGAGTLRGVFTTVAADGTRTFDAESWEKAIQQVLAACKEFNVPCGFPANTPDVMETRYKQGFSVFVIGWGDNGFKTVEAGLKLSGRQK